MLRVLYVEDNDDNIYMLKLRLELEDYEVLIARDGAEGVAMAKAENPDLILLDLGLPVIDGWEATRQLKANPGTRDIPIIALTAHSMVGDRDEALAVGCDEFDSKPVDFERLLAKMQAVLTARGRQ